MKWGKVSVVRVVKHIVKQIVKRRFSREIHVVRWMRGADEGSGTISGVALIAIAAIMIGAIAMAGDMLMCVHRAQNTADMAATVAADSLRNGASDPCEPASRTAVGHGTQLMSCVIEDEDASVTVRAATKVPFAPWVVRQSRAGPIDCD